MRHVKPHRWNDAWAGRISDAETAKMSRHADACPRCAAVRERVTRTSEAFAPIRTQSAPDLGWDTIRARIHWSVSSEHRKSLRASGSQRRPTIQYVALGLAAAAAAATLGIVAFRKSPTDPTRSLPVAHQEEAAGVRQDPVAPKPAPARLVGLVNRVTGDVMIDGVRSTDLFERLLVEGDVIATGEGRIDIQFGDASAFELGPRSTLELHRFDAETVELTVDGTVDVEVAPRTHVQRFIVHAGPRDIEVRGTQFRVTHGRASTDVACRHGLVAVRDAKGQVEVSGERRMTVHADHAVTDERVVTLTTIELASLASTTPYTMPLWTDADQLRRASSPLDVAGTGQREVRVDGIEHGVAPLRVRVVPGRHTVEAADSAGRFRRIGWIDVALGIAAHLDVPVEATPTPDISVRKKQLRAGLDQVRLAKCVRQIAKAGLSNTYVHVELSVDTTGAIEFLNVIDTDLPSTTAACVRQVLADVHFGPGATATWRERIDL